MRELLREMLAAAEQGHDCAYCSVVETRGSTPQKAGAAMVVFPDGSQRGTLGGGCIEAEVRQRALQSMVGGKPQLHTFTLDDNYGWDDGLICGGRMSILVVPLAVRPRSNAGGPIPQPIEEPASENGEIEYYRRLCELVEAGKGCTEAVVIKDVPDKLVVGTRFLFDGKGKPIGSTARGSIAPEVSEDLIPLEQRPRPSVRRGIAYLPLLPRVTILIVGGGHVGRAVAQLAADADFDIWALDDREAYASRERFPMAQRLLVGDIGTTLQNLIERDVDASVYCLIVTRGHGHDEEALYHLAQSRAGFVGMIGSQRKKKMIFEDLLAKGISEAALAKVHSPLGIDIGSQTVPEIAVSIVAQLIGYRNLGENGKAGGGSKSH